MSKLDTSYPNYDSRVASVIGSERLENAGNKRLKGAAVAIGLSVLPVVAVLSEEARQFINDSGTRIDNRLDYVNNPPAELPTNPSDMVVEVPSAPVAPSAP